MADTAEQFEKEEFVREVMLRAASNPFAHHRDDKAGWTMPDTVDCKRTLAVAVSFYDALAEWKRNRNT